LFFFSSFLFFRCFSGLACWPSLSDAPDATLGHPCCDRVSYCLVSSVFCGSFFYFFLFSPRTSLLVDRMERQFWPQICVGGRARGHF
jgi:hypothetical protein